MNTNTAKVKETGIRLLLNCLKKTNTASRLWRGTAILASLLFFHHFPYLVASSYMNREGFFSYDLLETGKNGITTFYWWTQAFLIPTSFYLTGTIYFIANYFISKSQKSKNTSNIAPPKKPWYLSTCFLFVIALVVNIVFFLLIKSNIIDNPTNSFFKEGHNITDIYLLYTIAAWIIFHTTCLIHAHGKIIFASLFIGALFLTKIAIFSPGTLALPYSLSLQHFGNGGGLPATIKLTKQNDEIKGKLILASPEHIYIYPKCKNEILVIPRSKVTYFSVENLSKHRHTGANSSEDEIKCSLPSGNPSANEQSATEPRP